MLPTLLLLLGLLGAASAQDEATFDAALRVLAERYPEEAQSGALYRAAIEGLASHVDELSKGAGSALLTESQMAGVRARQRGERQGIGVQFWVLAGQGVVINKVFEGSQAAAAQLQPGDLIVAVNDQPLTGRSRQAILALLSTVRPPTVVLDVRRQSAAPRTFRVPWGSYTLDPVVPCAAEEQICLEIQHFGTGAAAALEEALRTRDPGRGLVLDLRSNDEGVLEEMVAAADLFLEAGEVVTGRSVPGGTAEVLRARTPSAWKGRLVLIVDEGTAGVAEAFVAGLREQAQARVVGTSTRGLGTTTSFHPLGDGLTLRLADVRLSSPAGRGWAPKGLAPDLTVEHPDVLLPAGGVHALPDLQLEAAIRLLRGP